MRACVLTYILACSIQHLGAAAAACPTCWVGSKDEDTRSVVLLADWRQARVGVFFFAMIPKVMDIFSSMLPVLPAGTSCPSWQSGGAVVVVVVLAAAPLPPHPLPRPRQQLFACWALCFWPFRPPSLRLRCSSSATSCQHDDLSPAPAGEEYRAQLFRGGDQGMAGDEVQSDAVINLVGGKCWMGYVENMDLNVNWKWTKHDKKISLFETNCV